MTRDARCDAAGFFAPLVCAQGVCCTTDVLVAGKIVVQWVAYDRAIKRMRGVSGARGLPRQFRNMIDLMQYENKTDGGKQHEMRAEQPEY